MKARIIIGGIFGFIYVMSSAAALPSPAAQALRAIAIVAFVGLFLAIHRIGHPDESATKGRFGRGYWTVVAAEAIALLTGAFVLTGPLDAGDAVIAWVSVVVGVHFVALAAVGHQPFYNALGVAITICGVAALAAAALGASTTVIAGIGGVAPGFLLLSTAYRPTLRMPTRSARP
jgi:hypothetical protein